MFPVRRAALALCFVLCAVPAPAPAGERDSTREPSNLAVFGIDELERPTHRESFAMLQYTPDPIERVNRKSFSLTRGAIDWVRGYWIIAPLGVLVATKGPNARPGQSQVADTRSGQRMRPQ